jgi:hypothetical protein
LAQLLIVGTSPNPRWLIKFDKQPHKDEEMYERSFGRLISTTATDDDDPESSPPESAKQRFVKPKEKVIPAVGKVGSTRNSASSSEGEAGGEGRNHQNNSNNSKKGVTFSGSNVGSDASSTPETGPDGKKMSAPGGKVSAREQRSSRRQAKIDEDVVPGAVGEMAVGVGVVKRRIPPPTNSKNKRQRPADDGEVVKVKLLTGTLYLYRGKQRRAEFIRRV